MVDDPPRQVQGRIMLEKPKYNKSGSHQQMQATVVKAAQEITVSFFFGISIFTRNPTIGSRIKNGRNMAMSPVLYIVDK